jgi:hypothetical protein
VRNRTKSSLRKITEAFASSEPWTDPVEWLKKAYLKLDVRHWRENRGQQLSHLLLTKADLANRERARQEAQVRAIAKKISGAKEFTIDSGFRGFRVFFKDKEQNYPLDKDNNYRFGSRDLEFLAAIRKAGFTGDIEDEGDAPFIQYDQNRIRKMIAVLEKYTAEVEMARIGGPIGSSLPPPDSPELVEAPTPPSVKRCVTALAKQTGDLSRAFAICVAAGQKQGALKKGTIEPTKS